MEAWLALTLLAVGLVLIVGIALRSERETPSSGRGDGLVRLTAGPVREVLDGDTVIVQVGWDRVTIRLDGVDCPESEQPWGLSAKYGLIKLVGGRTVHFESHGIDRHERTLATLYVWDREESVWLNVNLRMVMLGHAWVSPVLTENLPASRTKELEAVCRWARRNRVGLWSDPAPVPPWQWRKGERP